MSDINPQYNDRVQYILKNKNLGDLITVEPIGWNSDAKEYDRHEKYHGIFPKFSNSLKFIDDAADYIQLVDDLYDIMGEIELIRNEKHPQTDVWTLTYSGYLDLSTWNRKDGQVYVKFNSGGLEQDLKARDSETVEVDRLTTSDDTAIPELNTINVELDGRKIFLQTKYEKNTATEIVELDVRSDGGNTRRQTGGFPLKLVNKSHESAQSVIYGSVGNESNGATGMMFFAVSDKDRDLHLSFEKIKFKPIVRDYDVDWAIISFCLSTYKDGQDYNLKNREYIFSSQNFPDGIDDINGKLREFNFERDVELLTGESLSLEFFIEADLESGGGQHFRVDFTEMDGKLTVDEDSFYEKSTTKAILAHELAERLVTIATNKQGVFYSDYFGRTDLGYPVDGKGAFIAFTHGFWVRQFDKLPLLQEETNTTDKVTNLFKPLTTSFNDFTASNTAILNIGVGIEKIGNKERVRIEELSYFYNRNVTIRLPNQVKNVDRKKAVDKYYSAIEIGYEKGGDYEEAFGLDEFNVKSNFSTFISRLKNIYIQISKYRADSYGMEFARRKPKTLNDTEDTGYDEDVFFLDLKRGFSNTFLQRKWQDDFEKEPTGIFSPETATNLRLSPVNSLLRHGWWISASVIKYATNKLKFGSSTANRQLKTKLTGGNEYAENDDIINSELQTARFIPEYVEFEHVCDFDVMQQVNGTSVILGKTILNLYGLVEFINENNEIERGFLMNLKPNGKGSWKVLKANR